MASATKTRKTSKKAAGKATEEVVKKARTKQAQAKKAQAKKTAAKKAPAKQAAAPVRQPRKAAAPKQAKAAVQEPERSAPAMAEVDQDVLEFIAAIDTFKQRHARPFPSWSEVLLIVKQLGYRR